MLQKVRGMWRSAASAAIVLFVLGASLAPADTIFTINTGNSALSGFPGPYATVDVHLDSSTEATITFTSLVSGSNINLIGDGGSADVNVNATSWTLSLISGANVGTGFTPGPWSDGGAGNVSSFGVFNQTINSFDGFTHSSDTLSFDLTNNLGTWASSDNVLTPNEGGLSVAMHVFVTSSPANATNGATVTGFASTGSAVPEPKELGLLVALGAFLAGAVRLRKRAVAS